MAPEFRRVPLGEIKARKTRFDESVAVQMMESVSTVGLLHPLTVVRNGRHYELVGGAGRLAALKQIGQAEAMCLVLPFAAESPEAELAYIDENLVRADLPPAQWDALYTRRTAILERLRPQTAPLITMKRAGKAHGKEGGRGKKKPLRPADAGVSDAQDPSSTTIVARDVGVSERTGQKARHRTEKSAGPVWDAYAAGALNRRQVDLLTQLPAAAQVDLLPQVTGKTEEETAVAVKAARVTNREERQVFKTLLDTTKRLNSNVTLVRRQMEIITQTLRESPELDVRSAGLALTVAGLEEICRQLPTFRRIVEREEPS